LQSWNPRRPSANLERRLFRAARPDPARRPGQAIWPRLVPALGCLLLTLLVAAHHPGGPVRSGAFDPARCSLLAASSNQAWISYHLPVNLEHNVFVQFPPPTFEWTNQSPFPSTTGSFGLLKTNSL